MDEPRLIDTVVLPGDTGAEIVWRVGGCQHKPYCHRTYPEGMAVDVCKYLSYKKDWINPGGIQEYCSATDAPLSTSEWSKQWKRDQK